jgi:hypothetical protein
MLRSGHLAVTAAQGRVQFFGSRSSNPCLRSASNVRFPCYRNPEVTGQDRLELGGSVASRHLTISRSMEVAQACAAGMPADRVLRALQSQEPIVVPHGRRLGGNAIRAAFVGWRMRALEWQPTVNVLGLWGADGTLTYLDLNRGERPIAELRWRAEGDRLCTTRQGCGEVLAAGRFLHLVAGGPPRLLMTVIAAPPEDGQGQAAGARRGGG